MAREFSVEGRFDELCRGPLHLNVFDDDRDEGGTYDRLGEGYAFLGKHALGLGQSTKLAIKI